MSARCLLISVVLLLSAGCGGGGSLKQSDVQKQFEAIQSLAAEGALVADGAADGRTTDVFGLLERLGVGAPESGARIRTHDVIPWSAVVRADRRRVVVRDDATRRQ